MKTKYLVLIVLILFVNVNMLSQQNSSIDINKKAEELGITTKQLEGILNSVSGQQEENNPQPDAMQEKFFTGQSAGDSFGFSVSTAGDVNGDGYDDFIIGSPYNDAGGSNAGTAYIYFGGVSMDNIADVTITGAAAGDNFGYSVSPAGDLNGDGYSDVIVGAPYNDNGGTDAGRVYIYFGGASMDNTAEVILTGAVAEDYFGYSVSTAGDVNGDGYTDIIVGASNNDAGGTNAGRAYIYFGGISMDNTADVILTGAAAADNFGNSVFTAGDVNGDGYSDVIVGAPFNDAGGTDAGRAYIYFGGSSMDNTADLILTGSAGGDNFGYSVSTAGDVNEDGYADVIVGAPGNDAGGSNTGRAYIYFGGAGMDNIADLIMTGAAAGDVFGYSVSTAGDVNGDSFDDVIVSAYQNDHGGLDAGRAYIYYGGEGMDNTADLIMTGAAAGDNFGYSVSTAGDVNGDGYTNVIVGAPYNDAGGTDAGSAYVYTNSLTGTDIPDEFFTGAAAGDNFGISVSTAGDVNGDGYTDMIVGAQYNDAGGTDAGRAFIYFGGLSMDNIADVILTGTAIEDYFGYSVSTAGDVNGDGYSDVIVGAYANDAGGGSAGRAYIYFGGASMDNTADVIMTGETVGDFLGFSVSTAGDVNGDGYSDVIVGAYQNDAGGTNAGRAYVYFGGVSMDNTAEIIMTGEATLDYFGYSVSTAGDVNGDGYSDVIVGALNNDAGGSNAGRTYIYFGGASMDNTADIIITGAASLDDLGVSVSTAGDVNGDGYSDVIVGAYGSDEGGIDAGRVYIYFGGASMDNTADVIMTGTTVSDFFGYSVSTAGDVNGDGYSDVIVDAVLNDAGGTDAGRAYIYFGGASMDNTADIIMTGAAAGDYFGNSISTIGDVNGDGYSDVIVGALYNDAGGTDAGRVYLYLSSPPPIKPRIMSVKDIPNDQGGYVRVKWIRSAYDIPGQNRIDSYILQRSDPPGSSGFVWDYVATIPAIRENDYSYVSPTPSDSFSNTSGTFYFRVIAHGINADENWYSNITYGHSVDNLAPLAPMGFYTQLNGSNVNLGWQANTEADLRDYYIYRSDTPLARDFTLLGTTTDTSFTDSSPPAGNAYYYIQAYDIHNNGSLFSTDSITALLSANIKVFLEGPYSSGVMSTTLNTNGYLPLSQPYNTAPWNYTGTETVASIPADVVDWVLLELRSDLTTQVARRAAFIKNDGSLVDLDGVSLVDFASVPGGSYYLVIYHRNHLQIMTANPVELSSSPTLYDLTTSSTRAYGTDPMKNLGGGVFGMYSGDTNNSGIVTASDKSLVNSFNLGTGYYNADTNFSGIVTAADKTNINSNNLKQEFVP